MLANRGSKFSRKGVTVAHKKGLLSSMFCFIFVKKKVLLTSYLTSSESSSSPIWNNGKIVVVLLTMSNSLSSSYQINKKMWHCFWPQDISQSGRTTYDLHCNFNKSLTFSGQQTAFNCWKLAKHYTHKYQGVKNFTLVARMHNESSTSY